MTNQQYKIDLMRRKGLDELAYSYFREAFTKTFDALESDRAFHHLYYHVYERDSQNLLIRKGQWFRPESEKLEHIADRHLTIRNIARSMLLVLRMSGSKQPISAELQRIYKIQIAAAVEAHRAIAHARRIGDKEFVQELRLRMGDK